MNQAEKKAYQRWKKVPAKLRERTAWDPIHQASKQRFDAEKEAITNRNAKTAPVYGALKSLIQESPQADALRAALSSVPQKRVNATIPKIAPIPAPKSAKLRLDPIQLIDAPPFVTDTWSQQSGNSSSISLNADPAGNLSFALWADLQVSCWAAAGGDYTPPSEGMLRFSASPSFSWSAWWYSDWWRLAAGQVWIGQLIIRFDHNGVMIDAPVQTQNILYSFKDRNLIDRGNQSGSSAGFSLQSQLIVDPAFVYRCSVWIGGSANADQPGGSEASVSLSASFSSIVLDLF